MFRPIIITLVFVSAQPVYAQSVEGLGDFKLGMSFSELESWLNTNSLKLEEVRDSMDAFRRERSGTPVAYVPLPNDASPYSSPSNVNYVPDHKSVVITRYSPAGISIEGVHLLFRNDKLIKIGAKSSDRLFEALSAKYGDPAVKTESKTITCRFTYTGATQEKQELTKYATWRDDEIKAYQTELYFYDSKCQLLGGRTLDIYVKASFNEYLRRNHAGEREYRERANQEKRQELKKGLDKL